MSVLLAMFQKSVNMEMKKDGDNQESRRKSLPADETGSNPYFQDPNLIHQAGYLLMSGSNTFNDLRQALNEEPHGLQEFTTVRAKAIPSRRLEDTFWTLAAELPSKPVIDELVDIYFAEVNWYYHILVRCYFDELYVAWCKAIKGRSSDVKNDHHESVSKDLLHVPALLFQVLAIALQFAPNSAAAVKKLGVAGLLARDRLSCKYSTKGLDVMNIIGHQHITISAVQHDLLRASWLKNCGQGTESWHSLGNAIRKAQELSLYQNSKIRPSESCSVGQKLKMMWNDEYKRRLWVTLFSWDSHMALALGRPRIINASDCDIKTPMNCDTPQDPSTTIPTPYASENDTMPTSFYPSLLGYSIAQMVHEMRTTGANKRFPKNYQVIGDMHRRILSLLDTVPPVFRVQNPDTSWDSRCPNLPRQREQIFMGANSLLLGLHRSHIHTHPESREAAIEAALSVLQAQQRFFDLTPSNQYRFFGLAFFTMDAATFLSAATMLHRLVDAQLKERIDFALHQALIRLEALQDVNPLARSGVKLLRYCFQKIQYSPRHTDQVPPNLGHSAVHTSPGVSATPLLSRASQDTLGHLPSEPCSTSEIFPTPSLIPGSTLQDIASELNTFDESYWIEQVNQIPMEEFGPGGSTWDTLFGQATGAFD
ncbi:hypothetical protein BP6252_07853 [Coleophoma cylindrospora]|uniref:Xylanolytic transcriptional activator regulatory domain-containing protein n=1 Tax=Coleophoma cylindrospora TaxID=1849047 RepID=A0A3D8RBD2_9HELO|nr:hypothetical protein BP6252_07853 [Coleophoma cylindrospora]